MAAKSHASGFHAGSAVRRIGSMPPNATAKIAYAGTRKSATSQMVPGAANAAQNPARGCDRSCTGAAESDSGTATAVTPASAVPTSAGRELRPLFFPDLIGLDGQGLEPQALVDQFVGQYRCSQVLGHIALRDQVVGVEPVDRRDVPVPDEVRLGVGSVEQMVDVQ